MTLSLPEWERRVAALQAKQESQGLSTAEAAHLKSLLTRRGKGHGYSREFVLAGIFQGGTQKGATGAEGSASRIDGANRMAPTWSPVGEGIGSHAAGFNRMVSVWSRTVSAAQAERIHLARGFQARRGTGSLPALQQFSTSASMGAVANRWAHAHGEYVLRASSGKWDRWVPARGEDSGYRLTMSRLRDRLSRITEEITLRALEAMDIRGTAWALEMWHAWPAYSGYSRSQIGLEWYSRGSEIALRLVSLAAYTLAAKPTAKPWGRARAGMNALIRQIAADVAKGEEIHG